MTLMAREVSGIILGGVLVLLVLISMGGKGASGYTSVNGDQYYEVLGDWAYSTWFSNGIILSPGGNPGSAAYALGVSPGAPCTYALTVGLYYHDGSFFGDGPSLYAWNWNAANWDAVLSNTGTTGGNNRDVSASVDPALYVSFSTLRLKVAADGLDATDVGYVYASWSYDSTPPTNPNGFTATVPTNVWSATRVLSVQWSGAADDRNGVAGYSI